MIKTGHDISMTEAATKNLYWTRVVIPCLEILPSHKIVFTLRSMLVRDAKVLEILDRELAVFYPEYWLYVKAYYWADWNSG